MTSSRLRRILGASAAVAALGLLFWLTAALTSALPDSQILAINLQGLTENPVGGGQRPAPLSLSMLVEGPQDGDAAASSASTATRSIAGGTPAARPAATPNPTPTSPVPLPTPTNPLPSPTPAGPGTIAGQVVDSSSGNAIPGATVSLSPGGASTLTDANGTFTYSVAAGSYTVTASAATYNSASASVTVRAGQRVTLVLRLTSVTAYGSITGTVVDAATQSPIVGATVRLSNGLVRVTDTNGNFSYSIVLSGSYTLTVSAVGYLTQSQSVTVRSGHTTKVLVGLTP